MLLKERVRLYDLRKILFFNSNIFSIILFSCLFLNVALADVSTTESQNNNIEKNTAMKSSPINGEAMSVVLTADDIVANTDEILNDAKEVPQGKSQNEKRDDTKSDKDVNVKEKDGADNANQNKNEQNRILPTPAVAQDDIRQPLPQVISQTQHIGTPEQPTIDGGLISAPELVGVLLASAENMPFEGSLNEIQALIFMKLNQVYFLWEGLKQYDLNPYDLQRGLSRIQLAHENYKEKIWIKCAQVLAYWTAPQVRHTSRRSHVSVKTHKTLSSSRKKIKGIRLAQLSEKSDSAGQPDFERGHYGNV